MNAAPRRTLLTDHFRRRTGSQASQRRRAALVPAAMPEHASGRKPFAAAVVSLIGLSLGSIAQAQTPSPLPEWEYSAGQPLRQYFEPKPPKWQLELGMGAAMQPDYDGSQQYQILPAPSFDLRYYNIAFFSVGEGLGVNFLHGKRYRVGAAITYDLGRKLNSDLRVTEYKVPPTAELKLFAEYVFFPVVTRIDVRRALGSGYDGFVGDLSVYMPVAGSKKYKYFVFAGPSITFADRSYMQHFFSVTPSAGAGMTVPSFSAHGGLKEASFGVNATWFYSGSWFVNGVAAVGRLLGSASSSPLTQAHTQAAVNFTFGYLFGASGM